MKSENTLSGLAVLIASLSITDMINVSLAAIVAITAVLVNLSRRKAEKARAEKERAEKELLEQQLKQLSDEK